MLRSHPRPSIGVYSFTQSHAIFTCLVLILLRILSRGLSLLDYALWKIRADTFVRPLCTSENVRHISGALFPTNACMRLVTWQPQEPIKLPSCDLATRTANHSVLLWPCSRGMAQQLVQPWSLASNHLSCCLFLLVCGGQRIDCNCRGCLSSQNYILSLMNMISMGCHFLWHIVSWWWVTANLSASVPRTSLGVLKFPHNLMTK